MKKIIFIMMILTGSLFGEYCYRDCKDSLNDNSSIEFEKMLRKEFSEINVKINDFDENLKKLNNLTVGKLQQYIAIRELKINELNELEKINSLIEKLIEQENIRIKALNIKAKTDITSEVLNNE